MMTVSRFQLIINHDDPDVVSNGLDDFRRQILVENNAVNSFGYCGRPINLSTESKIEPLTSSLTVGLLRAFIDSSPQLEEFFVLWLLPGRNSDLHLSSCHTNCLAAILHCAFLEKGFCENVIRRIHNDFSMSLEAQLLTGDLPLIHSTLGLYIIMSRASMRCCTDTYPLIPFTSDVFGRLIQKGKLVRWSDQSSKLELRSDSRVLIMVLMFSIFEHAAEYNVIQLLHSPIFKKITHSINKDCEDVITLFLSSVLSLFKSHTIIRNHLHILIDDICVEKLVSLYVYENSLSKTLHQFFLSICKLCEGDNASEQSTSVFFGNLLKNLSPSINGLHREFRLALLVSHPSFLSKCISIAKFNWIPRCEESYIAALSHVSDLLRLDAVDEIMKSKTLKTFSCDGKDKSTIDDLVCSLVPIGLTKVDIEKMINHKNMALRRCCIDFVLSVIYRLNIMVLTAAVRRSPQLDCILATSLFKIIPDFHFFVAAIQSSQEFGCKKAEENVGDSFDFNLGLVEDSASTVTIAKCDSIDSASSFRLLLMRILSQLSQLIPSVVSQINGELMQLFDDLIPWSPSSEQNVSVPDIKLVNTPLILDVVRLLRFCTVNGTFRWFGLADDAVKNLIQLFVCEDWMSSLKKTPVSKLIFLGHVMNEKEGKAEIENLLRSILLTSGLFEGHDTVDSELHCELFVWCEVLMNNIKASDAHRSLSLSCVILQISYHWNAQLARQLNAYFATFKLENTYVRSVRKEYPFCCTNEKDFLPFSPLLLCLSMLTGKFFSPFIDKLPKHIRAYMVDDDVNTKSTSERQTFFDKFDQGACAVAEQLLSRILFNVALSVRCRVHYLTSFTYVCSQICSSSVLSQRLERVCVEVSHTADIVVLFDSASNILTLSTLNRIAGIDCVVMSTRHKKQRRVHPSVDVERNCGFVVGWELLDSFLSFCRTGVISISSFEGVVYPSPSQIFAFLTLNLKEIICTSFLNTYDFDSSWLGYIHYFLKRHWESIVQVYLTIHDDVLLPDGTMFAWCLKRIQMTEVQDKYLSMQKSVSNGLQLNSFFLLLARFECGDKESQKQDKDEPSSSKRPRDCLSDYMRLDFTSDSAKEFRECFMRQAITTIKNVVMDRVVSELLWCTFSRFADDDTFIGLCIRELLTAAAKVLSETYRENFKNSGMSVQFWSYILENMQLKLKSFSNISQKERLEDSSFSSLLFETRHLLGEFHMTETYSKLMNDTTIAKVLDDLEDENGSVQCSSSIFTKISCHSADLLRFGSLVNIDRVLIIYALQKWVTSSETIQLWNSFACVNFNVPVVDNLSFFVSPLDLTTTALCAYLLDIVGVTNGEITVSSLESILLTHSPQILAKVRANVNDNSRKSLLLDLCTRYIPSNTLYLPHACTCPLPVSENRVADISFEIDLLCECICVRLESGMPFVTALEATFAFRKLLASEFEEAYEHMLTNLAEYVQSSPFARRRQLLVGDYLSRSVLWFPSYVTHSDTLTVGWLNAYFSVAQYYLTSCSLVLAENEIIMNYLVPAGGNSVDSLFIRLREHFSVSLLPNSLNASQVVLDWLITHRESFTSAVKKWVRTCLKLGFNNASVLSCLTALIPLWNGKNISDDRKSVWFVALSIASNLTELNIYSPSMILSMVIGHSLFKVLLTSGKYSTSSTRELLLLLLRLVSMNQELQVSSEERYLAQMLQQCYTGTLSYSDRLILRILSILQYRGVFTKCWCVCMRSSEQVISFDNDVCEAPTDTWLFRFLKQPTVHATLAQFPLWRKFVPIPFFSECDVALYNCQLIESKWRDLSVAGNEILPPKDQVDLENGSADLVYDPSYFVRVIYEILLNNTELSVRHLANCGGLSLLISSLCSSCSVLRTIALAGLQLVYTLLKKQTVEVDPAFRERAQILLLLGFIKNSISSGKSFSVDTDELAMVPSLSPTVAIFLGSAAMNMMQPSHRMYAKINKYILSRPFCDEKDVPLFDLLILNGIAEKDQNERLVVLRLIRDGLLTSEDFNNLCRKNAFNRLMLLCPLILTDIRSGHAVLDIVDRALTVNRQSSRYLVERCGLLDWLQCMCSPSTSLLTSNELRGGLVCVSDRNMIGQSDAIYFRFLSRLLTLLRRLVFTLTLDLFDSSVKFLVRQIHSIVRTIINDTLDACIGGGNIICHSIPLEFLESIVAYMWDLTKFKNADTSVNDLEWTVDVISSLNFIITARSQNMDSSITFHIQYALLNLLSLEQVVKTPQQIVSDIVSNSLTQYIELTIYFFFKRFSLQSGYDYTLQPSFARDYSHCSIEKNSQLHESTQVIDRGFLQSIENRFRCDSLSKLPCDFDIVCYIQFLNNWGNYLLDSNLLGISTVRVNLVIWKCVSDQYDFLAEVESCRLVRAIFHDVRPIKDSNIALQLQCRWCVHVLQLMIRLKETFLWKWLKTDNKLNSIFELYHLVCDQLCTFTCHSIGSSLFLTNLIFCAMNHVSMIISFHDNLHAHFATSTIIDSCSDNACRIIETRSQELRQAYFDLQQSNNATFETRFIDNDNDYGKHGKLPYKNSRRNGIWIRFGTLNEIKWTSSMSTSAIDAPAT